MQDLNERIKKFIISVLALCEQLPKTRIAYVIESQIIRAVTSVGANYRAAKRGRSTAEFLAKMGIVEEESDEVGYWLELMIDSKTLTREVVQPLINEANELTAIFVTIIKNTKAKQLAKK